ncbi:MAG: ABC transporter ATP-binding protein [Clostridia bacterium]|nr:ABC transporter ATP-binding protein [Clostridia bacterium]
MAMPAQHKASNANIPSATKKTAATPHADKTPAIEITKLVKQYPSASSPAVKDFSLTCYGGEIVGLLGHNGAGKSTTLKCLTGMLPFTSGRIRINGYNIKTSPVKAKFTFGFVSDKHDVFVKMTGIQYINFMADAYDISKEEHERSFRELDGIFKLGDKLSDPISTYSHGMRQKICMMGSLIHRPKLWILDEPMIGLDPLTYARVSEYMREYAAKGNCILFSSHNVNSVRKICTRAVIINGGVKTDDINFKISNLSGEDLENYFLKRTVKNVSDTVNDVNEKVSGKEPAGGKENIKQNKSAEGTREIEE